MLLYLLGALLRLRQPLGEDLLPLPGRVHPVEALVVLDELQGLLPLHRVLVPHGMSTCVMSRYGKLLLVTRLYTSGVTHHASHVVFDRIAVRIFSDLVGRARY